MTHNKMLLILILSTITISSFAQLKIESTGPKTMFNQLTQMDSLLFDNQFNQCNCEEAKTFFTEDLEFYHDQQGLQFTSRAKFLEEMKERCDSWFKDGLPRTKRKLVKGSLRIYPLKNYGAIQTGIHQFHELQANNTYKLVTIAKFTHVWKKEADNQWKLARILSYDHQPAE